MTNFWAGFALAMCIACIIALLIARKIGKGKATGVKVLLFGLFFWVAMFTEAGIYAIYRSL